MGKWFWIFLATDRRWSIRWQSKPAFRADGRISLQPAGDFAGIVPRLRKKELPNRRRLIVGGQSSSGISGYAQEPGLRPPRPFASRKPPTVIRLRDGRMAAMMIAEALFASAAVAGDAPDALLTTPDHAGGRRAGRRDRRLRAGRSGLCLGLSAGPDGAGRAAIYRCPANNPPTSYRAPLNQIGWARELATAASKDMPTSNNDTFYMSAIVDLDRAVRPLGSGHNDRYYVVDVFNM